MAWYLNTSKRTQAVAVGNGNVVAVRPNERVEVIAETEEMKRLIRLRILVRSGRPQHAVVGRKLPVVAPTTVEPSIFQKHFTEKVPVASLEGTQLEIEVPMLDDNAPVAAEYNRKKARRH